MASKKATKTPKKAAPKATKTAYPLVTLGPPKRDDLAPSSLNDSTPPSNDDENPWLVPLIVAIAIYQQQQRRIGSNRLWTSQEYTDNLLNCGNSIRIRN